LGSKNDSGSAPHAARSCQSTPRCSSCLLMSPACAAGSTVRFRRRCRPVANRWLDRLSRGPVGYDAPR